MFSLLNSWPDCTKAHRLRGLGERRRCMGWQRSAPQRHGKLRRRQPLAV
jgi:hypothetical protein